MFNFKWPFTNQYVLNLDWLLSVVKDMGEKVDKVKDAYSPEQPPPYPVTSVEGKTGNVQIDFPVESVNGKTGVVVTPFTGYGMEPLKMFDADSNAQYYGFNRRLADGKTLECWIKEDGHLSLVLRAADGQELGNWQTVNNAEIPSSEVLSVNGKAGVVVLNAVDVGAVPTTRTINSKPLSASVTLNASDVGAVPTGRTINNKKLTADITLTPEDLGMGDVLFNGSAALNVGGTINIDRAVEGSHIYWVRLSYAVGIAVPSGSNYGLSIMASSYDTDKLMFVRLEPTSPGATTLRLDYAYQVEFTGSGTVRRATFTPTIQHIERMY